MDPMVRLPLGVVVERREIDNPWQSHTWRAVAVIPGAPAVDGWTMLLKGPRWIRYHAATLPVVLHRSETAAYLTNLSSDQPAIYVGLRDAAEAGESGFEVAPFMVTASPFEAQDYLDSSEVVIERVPMPDGVIAWVQAFVDAHHVDKPFEKRKRERLDPNELGFGRRPGDAAGSRRTRGKRP